MAAAEQQASSMLIVMGRPDVVHQQFLVRQRRRCRSGTSQTSGCLVGLRAGSLMLGAMRLVEERAGWSLPEALATVSLQPAKALGLGDRGMIARAWRRSG
jgi:alpha-D-ribose 1-methylphosphonate 5-triphosphate diphosphatase